MRSVTAVVTILLFSFTMLMPAYSQQDADIESILKEGKEAYLNGEYNKAIEKLSVAVRFLRVQKDLVDANVTLALAHLALGNTAGCQTHIKGALKVKPDLSLSIEEYSPKFIELVDTTKKENIIQVIFKLMPAATLYLNGFKVQEGDLIEIPVLKGENSIKVVKEGYTTVEQEMLFNQAGDVKEITLEKVVAARNGVIEKPGVKKKKKFPWLIVIGGVIVLGAIIYFLILKKTKYTLTAEVGEGVTGTPSSGSRSYNKGDTVTYNYTLEPGYGGLTVTLNGQEVNASGIIKMDKNYKIEAKSSGLAADKTLLVIKESGVSGNPDTGYYSYVLGERIEYSYTAQAGYTGLQVKLDNVEVAASGSFVMDTNHTLHASAVPTSGGVTLTVSRGNGVNGDPASGTYTYQIGDTVNYSYSLKSGYTDLVVKLDGIEVSASGTVTMDRNHTLSATSSGGSTNQYTLTVDLGTGVSGNPASGSYNYNSGEQVSYSYSLEDGYTNLVVKLDGITVGSSGSVTMDASHNLTATASQATGSLKCTSTPNKAEIWIDGENTGKKCVSVIQLPVGQYEVTLKLSGYKDYVETVTIYENQTTNVVAVLEAE